MISLLHPKSRTTLLICLPLLCVHSVSYALTPYTATYVFKANNILKTQATRSLSKLGDNAWKYSFNASIAGIGKATEESTFTIESDEITPQNYTLNTKLPFNKKHSEVYFNHEKQQLNFNDNGKKSTKPMPKAVIDSLALDLQLKEDIKNNNLKSVYHIVDQRGTDKIQFIIDGEDKISTPAGVYNTIKVHRIYDNDAEMIFWMAPSLDYVPVRLYHRWHKTTYQLDLSSFKQQP